MVRFLLICFAGALGTGTRYLVGLGAARWLGTSFPYGTLAVNVVGCFLIAAVMRVALATDLVSPTLRLTLTTGFMGGLTTYSAFNYEATRFFEERAYGMGVLYMGVTLVACLVSGLAGAAIAARVAT